LVGFGGYLGNNEEQVFPDGLVFKVDVREVIEFGGGAV